MKKHGRLWVGLGGLVLLLAAVLPSGSRQAAAQTQDRPSGPDQAVVRQLHQLNQDEITKAQIGLRRASRPEVRDYAAMLVREHGAADEKLLAYARQVNMNMDTITGAGDARATGALATADLSLTAPAAFDHRFATEMVATHQAAIDAAQTGQGLAKDARLPELIAQMLPTLNAHLAIAQELATNLPEPPPSRVQPPGDFPAPSRTQTGVEERAGAVRVTVP